MNEPMGMCGTEHTLRPCVKSLEGAGRSVCVHTCSSRNCEQSSVGMAGYTQEKPDSRARKEACGLMPAKVTPDKDLALSRADFILLM